MASVNGAVPFSHTEIPAKPQVSLLARTLLMFIVSGDAGGPPHARGSRRYSFVPRRVRVPTGVLSVPLSATTPRDGYVCLQASSRTTKPCTARDPSAHPALGSLLEATSCSTSRTDEASPFVESVHGSPSSDLRLSSRSSPHGGRTPLGRPHAGRQPRALRPRFLSHIADGHGVLPCHVVSRVARPTSA